MSVWPHYRGGKLGQALQQTVAEMLSAGDLSEEQGDAIMEAFDKVQQPTPGLCT